MADLLYIRRRRISGVTEFPKDYLIVLPRPVTPIYGREISDRRVGLAPIRTLIGDANSGTLLGEIAADLQHVSWLISRHGDAQFVLPSNDPAVRSGLIQPGRRIALEIDNGLPVWGGVIDVPTDNDGLTTTWRAYESSYLLRSRYTGRHVKFAKATAGGVVSALMTAANAAALSGIVLIVHDSGETTITQEYHLEALYDVFERDIWPLLEFRMTPVVTDSISFIMEVGVRIGRDVSGRVALVQGVNTDRPKVTTQGPIINHLTYAAGDGAWDPSANDARAVVTVLDDRSIKRYGLRQGVHIASVNDAPTLEKMATADLAEMREPYRAISLSALNLPPATFGDYQVGDTVSVELFGEYGMGGGDDRTARVLGREFRPADGVCRLILANNR